MRLAVQAVSVLQQKEEMDTLSASENLHGEQLRLIPLPPPHTSGLSEIILNLKYWYQDISKCPTNLRYCESVNLSTELYISNKLSSLQLREKVMIFCQFFIWDPCKSEGGVPSFFRIWFISWKWICEDIFFTSNSNNEQKPNNRLNQIIYAAH